MFTDEDISNLQELRCSSTSHPLLLDSVNVSESAVFELMRDLDPNKACGPDLIPARLLKEGAEEISHSLSRIFRLSLCSGTLYPKTGYHIVPVLWYSIPQDWISYCSCALVLYTPRLDIILFLCSGTPRLDIILFLCIKRITRTILQTIDL